MSSLEDILKTSTFWGSGHQVSWEDYLFSSISLIPMHLINLCTKSLGPGATCGYQEPGAEPRVPHEVIKSLGPIKSMGLLRAQGWMRLSRAWGWMRLSRVWGWMRLSRAWGWMRLSRVWGWMRLSRVWGWMRLSRVWGWMRLSRVWGWMRLSRVWGWMRLSRVWGWMRLSRVWGWMRLWVASSPGLPRPLTQK